MKRLFIAVAIALVLGMTGCWGNNPAGPDHYPPPDGPPPTPKPTVVIPPQLEDIKVGGTVCCAPPRESGEPDWGLVYGWPLITYETAKRYAEAGIQIIHIRTEPQTPQIQAQLAQVTRQNELLGMWSEVTLVDGWFFREPHILNPWGENCAVFRNPPQEHHREHVRTVVRQSLAGSKYVIFDVGNEVGLCRPSIGWYAGIAEEARLAGAIYVGGDANLPFLDYYNYHGFHIENPGKLSFMNESDNENYSPSQWESLIRAGIASGVKIFYWPGPHTIAQREETLKRIKGVITGDTGSSCQAPSSCPTRSAR